MTLRSMGKVSLEEYGRQMQECYLGISLMLSPHPSYPPLEMPQFGMRVITNGYRNKRLDDFSPLITSLPTVNPESVAAAVADTCAAFQEDVVVKTERLSTSFMREQPDFSFLADLYQGDPPH